MEYSTRCSQDSEKKGWATIIHSCGVSLAACACSARFRLSRLVLHTLSWPVRQTIERVSYSLMSGCLWCLCVASVTLPAPAHSDAYLIISFLLAFSILVPRYRLDSSLVNTPTAFVLWHSSRCRDCRPLVCYKRRSRDASYGPINYPQQTPGIHRLEGSYAP
jgi:hypothetical protein